MFAATYDTVLGFSLGVFGRLADGSNVHCLAEMIFAYQQAVKLHNSHHPGHEKYRDENELKLRRYVVDHSGAGTPSIFSSVAFPPEPRPCEFLAVWCSGTCHVPRRFYSICGDPRGHSER